MDVIEKAIRSAFDKGDATDRAFREKVYRQAFAALDRALQNNPAVTVETAMQRRKQLQSKIVEIEQEQLSGPSFEDDVSLDAPLPEIDPRDHIAPPSPPPVAPPVSHEPWQEPPPEPRRGRVEPGFDEPSFSAEPGELSAGERNGAAPPRRRKGRRFVRMFIGVTLFAMLALGVWWAAQTGLLTRAQPPEQFETTQEPESFEPGQDEPPVQAAKPADNRTWVTIFRPTDMESISPPGDATAELKRGDNGDFVQIKSGPSGSAVMFDVGQGVLQKIAGKKATFDIIAKTLPGEKTQMSVLCNFGELGDCGRKRYDVSDARADYLFELTLPNTAPGAGGTIAIDSDFNKTGKSVDIYEIRVSTE